MKSVRKEIMHGGYNHLEREVLEKLLIWRGIGSFYLIHSDTVKNKVQPISVWNAMWGLELELLLWNKK